jgi:large-conductance mechanosensitive channel
MKKILLITVTSFVIAGVLIFIGLNVMNWVASELEKNQRPKRTQAQTLKK